MNTKRVQPSLQVSGLKYIIWPFKYSLMRNTYIAKLPSSSILLVSKFVMLDGEYIKLSELVMKTNDLFKVILN